MGKFILGVVVTLAVLAAGSYIYLHLGYLDTRADVQPSALELREAMAFMDASTERHAPDQKNPVVPNDANLIEGVKLYKADCAVCHGAPNHPEKEFGHPFYPPAPQFMQDAPDMPESENVYIIKHGVRWTGMPAWEHTLSDDQVWKLAAFLARMEKLPPAVEEEWQKPLPSPGNTSSR